MAARLSRTNPVTVNELLDGHKALEIDCLDRVYQSMVVPNLMVGGQVLSFLTQHEGQPIPSPALLERRAQACVSSGVRSRARSRLLRRARPPSTS